jgi:uncharacterized membrane protein
MDFVGIVLPRLALGLGISCLIGLVAYRRGSLSRSGVLGAILTGTTIFGFGGWTAGILLVAFFVSSSLLSHFKQNSAQKQRAAEMFDKGGQRDIWQALANGGAAALFAVAYWLIGLSDEVRQISVYEEANRGVGAIAVDVIAVQYAPIPLAAMLGALATVTADTWATELGVLNKTRPRLITDLSKIVEPGTSGGITSLGIITALLGSVFIALLFLLFDTRLRYATFFDGRYRPELFLAIVFAGFIGSLFDSLLGATKQAIYFSQQRQKETEKAFEKDGTPNKHLRGWKWLNNDWVNFISSVVGALVAAGLVILI